MAKKNWNTAFQPLIKLYKGKKHPLDYQNTYQLLVMVLLAAQDSDKHINAVVPPLFEKYPSMEYLATATEPELLKYLKKVRGSARKVKWLLAIAKKVKTNRKIPMTLDGLVELPGIGRKSANVILREAKKPAEGIMVDLHVVRVAPRLGITDAKDPLKIEEDLMAALKPELWSEAGMALSFLGRETCRPSHPNHADCVMKKHCRYHLTGK